MFNFLYNNVWQENILQALYGKKKCTVTFSSYSLDFSPTLCAVLANGNKKMSYYFLFSNIFRKEPDFLDFFYTE